MKGNEFFTKDLRPDAVEWLAKLRPTLTVKEYGKKLEPRNEASF